MYFSKKLTDFVLKVYSEVLKIHAGDVKTYKKITLAIKCPRAYRVAGSVLRKNPFSSKLLAKKMMQLYYI